MKKILTVLFTAAFFTSAFPQIPLTVLPSGGNKKAAVREGVGLTDLPLALPDQTTFYGGDDCGYLDYPLADSPVL